jgi:catechol-2,3-dioxygenase
MSVYGEACLFHGLRLQTHAPEALKHFYGQQLGLPVTEDEGGTFCVQAGGTRLEFWPAPPDSQPYYHFAFNIPENKINRAAEWMAERAMLLPHRETGEPVTHWEHWNAHAIYFEDPAGNIVEFIARHTLDNRSRGGFDPGDILYASEIGMVVPDVPTAAQTIASQLGVEMYGAVNEAFAAVGDENGLFILVTEGRAWWPTQARLAQAFPEQVVVSSPGVVLFSLPSTLYEIIGLELPAA